VRLRGHLTALKGVNMVYGVLVDKEIFIPYTSILEINMETKTIWMRNYDETQIEKCWSRTYKEIKSVTVDSSHVIGFH
jgi:reverse gyrase